MKTIAIVTGASSGLGREFVRQIDADGPAVDEIWVIARRAGKLLELRRTVRTPVQVLPLDLTLPDSIDRLAEKLRAERPQIRLLVCSAGFGRVGSYAEISRRDCDDMIALNCRAAVDVTQCCIPYMEAGGRIAEICSMVAFLPLSYMNVYAASKAFLLRYSRALRVELKPAGVSVTAVCPYWVTDTEFVGQSRKSGGAQRVTFYKGAAATPDTVRKAMRDIRRGRAVSTPSPVSRVMRVAGSLLPDTALLWCWERLRA